MKKLNKDLILISTLQEIKLPKFLNKREAKITPKVLAWFQRNYPSSVALEIKMVGGKVKDHQRAALQKVASNEFAYKLPDMGNRNPFDAIVLKNADAFIVWCADKQCNAVQVGGDKKLAIDL